MSDTTRYGKWRFRIGCNPIQILFSVIADLVLIISCRYLSVCFISGRFSLHVSLPFLPIVYVGLVHSVLVPHASPHIALLVVVIALRRAIASDLASWTLASRLVLAFTSPHLVPARPRLGQAHRTTSSPVRKPTSPVPKSETGSMGNWQTGRSRVSWSRKGF